MNKFTYSPIGAIQFLKQNKNKIGNLTMIEKSVFGALCNFSNKEGICYPKVATIAESISCTKRSVQKAFVVLLNKGLIRRTFQFNKTTGLQRQNLYAINLNADLLEEWANLNKKHMQKEKERRAYQEQKNVIIKKRIAEKENIDKREKNEALKLDLRDEIKELKGKYQIYKKKATKAKIELKIQMIIVKKYIQKIKSNSLNIRDREFLTKNISNIYKNLEKSILISPLYHEYGSPPEKNIAYAKYYLLKKKKRKLYISKTNNSKAGVKKCLKNEKIGELKLLKKEKELEKCLYRDIRLVKLQKNLIYQFRQFIEKYSSE
ncbi:MAG: helix-turn-helix domain-containing protein [Clostridiales bacterium]|jgi:hypothetical protein|nr:helix-turn-helix domain-containing protein [Clostridiales bacterium]